MRARYVVIYLAMIAAPVPGRADTLYWLGAKLPNGATYPDGGGDPVPYYVDETQASPGGLPVSHVEKEVRAAYQRWQDVSCSYIGFAFQGAITDPAKLGTHADRKSVMGSFVDSRSDPRYADDLGNGVAVGVALTYKDNGVILGCDTEFNHADYTFTDDTPATGMDFPSLANHEQGHCLGLDHDPNDFESVMYPTVNPGDMRRTLAPHDINNICQLYPETGALGSPCSGSSCGNGLFCIQDPVNGGNFCSHGCDPTDAASCGAGFGCRTASAIPDAGGACYPGTGDFSPNIGAACTQKSDCQAASAICITNFPGGYCSQYCDSAQCPTGDLCEQLDSQHFYCVAPCTTYGGGCRDGYSCYPSDIQGNGFCYPACSSNADCASGDSCLPDGVCYTPGNGASSVGHACLSPNDCPTGGYCITNFPGGYCSAPCGSGQNAARRCDPGSTCVIAGAEGQTYCLQSCAGGAACRQGYSCTVRTGTDHLSHAVCLPGCTYDSDCAVGLACRNGSCVDPYATYDAGRVCDLCGSDGGTVQIPDAGHGPGTPPASPGGCGCSSGPAGLFALWAVTLFALERARRRAW